MGQVVELTRYEGPETFSLVPRTFAEAKEMAQFIASSDMVPKDFRAKPANVLVAIQMGREVGLSPTQALQNIAVINGRPAIWGDAMLALCQSDPTCEDVIETFDDATMTARCEVRRRAKEPLARTFSQADAKLAKLWGKEGPWTQYPKRMLQLRARAFALRDAYSARLKGLQMAEEMQDIPIKDVTPGKEAKAVQRPSRVIDAEVVQGEKVSNVMQDDTASEYLEPMTNAQPIDDYLAGMQVAQTEAELKTIGLAMNGHLAGVDRKRAVEAYKKRLSEIRLQTDDRAPGAEG